MNIKQLAIETVEELSGIKFEEFSFVGSNGRITRKREYVVLRRIAIVLIKEDSNFCLKGIGRIFGGQDHSTVIHALNTHEDSLKWDKDYRILFTRIKARYLEKKASDTTLPINEEANNATLAIIGNTYNNVAQL